MRQLHFVMLLVLCMACSNPSRNQQQEPEQSVPEALQENKNTKGMSKRAPENLVDELYEEQRSGDSSLQQMEESLEKLQEAIPDSLRDFHFFDGKNTSYFRQAEAFTLRIRDSLLKKETAAWLEQAENAYIENTASLNALKNAIGNNSLSLTDRHNILKLMVSLTMMKRYQRENRPQQQPLERLSRDQQRLISALDAAIQKNK